MTDPRKPIFEAVRAARGTGFSDGEVLALDNVLDGLGVPRAITPGKRRPGPACIDLLHQWEGCARKLPDGRYAAYPDPGSKDGKPWTIGYGSTGPGIGPGTIWTKQECDERFANDLQAYADEVSRAIGSAPTTQNQFDALVAFHYNTGKIGSATLTKKHKAGDYAGAAAEFGKWVYNDGKVMRGLVNRRAAESALYRRA